MVDTTAQQGASPTGSRHRALCNPVAICPMATTCKGMMENPRSGFLLILPGAVLIGLGVLTILEPGILVWLVGTASVLLGFVLLLMARFIRKLPPGRPRRDGGQESV